MSKKTEYSACSPSRVNYFISSLQNFEKEALTSTSFGPLVELPNVRTCLNLIYLLIEKFDFVNEWFVIGGKRLRFHMYEMAVITGLDVVGRQGKVDKKVSEDEVKQFCCKYFGKKREIARNEIEDILNNLNSSENLDDFRKLSLLYFLVTFLIPNKERTINIEYVYMVYDIREFNNIAWGKIVYDELLKGLKICSKKFKSYKKHTHLNGCAYALQVWALERLPMFASHSFESRIPRYRRYSAFLPLKREIYECALKGVEATAEIKVSHEESRISVIRKALNAREIEKNTTDWMMKRIKSLEKDVKRLRSLEEEFLMFKKGYAEPKQSQNENTAFFGSRKENKHTNMSKEKVPKGSSINNRTTPLTESIRERREEVPNSEPKGSSRNVESRSIQQEAGEFSRQRREREGNNVKVDNDVINLASDAAEVPIDFSTTPIVDEFGNDSTRSVNIDLLKSFKCIGKRVPKKSSWLRTPYQAYDNRRAKKKQLNAKEVMDAYFFLLKKREEKYKDKFLECHFFPTWYLGLLHTSCKEYNNFKAKYDTTTGSDDSLIPAFILSSNLKKFSDPKRVGYQITTVEKIFMPIHRASLGHWAYFIINLKEKWVQVLHSFPCDPLLKYEEEITVLDFFPLILSHLGNDMLDLRLWSWSGPMDIPRQTNGWDCGMFVLKYIDYASRNAPYSFTEEDMIYFRRRAAFEIIVGAIEP